MLFIAISATVTNYLSRRIKEWFNKNIYIRWSHDALLKITASLQHTLLSWTTGKVLSSGYNGLEDLQLFGLLSFKCIGI